MFVIVAMAVFAALAFAAPAEPYRLAFVTMPVYQANETDIAVYNQWMQEEANAAGIGIGGIYGDLEWNVIGSTDLVDARDNTGTNPATTGVPIYLTDGVTKVADNNADLWDGTIDSVINTRADGTVTTGHTWVFSGTTLGGVAVTPGADGTNPNTGPLGTSLAEVAQGNGGLLGTWSWRTQTNDPKGDPHPLYAMSEVIPEPATMCLLGLGGLALLRRRR